MGKKTLNLSDDLYDYLLKVSLRDNTIHKELRDETNTLEMSRMQISADQGQFMQLLLKLINAKRVIEIGTFTGYSALLMAEVLPDDGELVACDISEEWTDMGKHFWKEAGVDHKITLLLAPAIDTLEKRLLADGQAGSFDAAFIDADKQNLKPYYENCLKLIRPGGLIMLDNVLWGGSVIDPEQMDDNTRAIREMNEFLTNDERVDISLVPIGDGLTLARKR